MNEKDERLLTLLELTAPREEVVQEVRYVLEKMYLYFENIEVLGQIDDDKDFLNTLVLNLDSYLEEALSEIQSQPYAVPFMKLYDELTDDGKSAYWSGSGRIDLIPITLLPWRTSWKFGLV